MMTSCCPVRNEHKHQTSTHTHIPYTPYHTNHFQKQPNNNNNNRVRRSMFHTGFFIQIIIIIIFAYAADSCNMTFTSPLLVGCIHSSIQFIHRIWFHPHWQRLSSSFIFHYTCFIRFRKIEKIICISLFFGLFSWPILNFGKIILKKFT